MNKLLTVQEATERPTKRAIRLLEEDIEALIRVGYRPVAPKSVSGARDRVEDTRA